MTTKGAHLLRQYLPLVVGVPVCLGAGWFELTRALGGREVAWVYAFEWPFYAVAGTYMWWQVWRPRPRVLPEQLSRAGPTIRREPVRRVAAASLDDDDPGLVAWQRYLARLEAVDPPGGPPPRP